jgi:hypothetical protein
MNPLTIIRRWVNDPAYIAGLAWGAFVSILVVGAVFALRGLA